MTDFIKGLVKAVEAGLITKNEAKEAVSRYLKAIA